MQEKNGGLIAGIKALPGLPVATSARVLEPTGESHSKYHRAFLLPANTMHSATNKANQSIYFLFKPSMRTTAPSKTFFRNRL